MANLLRDEPDYQAGRALFDQGVTSFRTTPERGFEREMRLRVQGWWDRARECGWYESGKPGRHLPPDPAQYGRTPR